MNKALFLFFLAGLVALLAFLPSVQPSWVHLQTSGLPDSMPLSDLLRQLGEAAPIHQARTDLPGVSVERGRELATKGYTTKPSGKRSKRISRFFVCTACHNLEREDPDLSRSDPQARLEYTAARQMPFLQGTTFYGLVNRSSFYNGDYEKKYGDLVKLARHNLRAAIQLCAVECSQGRELAPWEVESLLAYFWTLELKVGDLGLSAEEKSSIEKALQGRADRTTALEIIRQHHLPASPASFVAPPEDRKQGYALLEEAEPDNGRLIYQNSCLHCHLNERFSQFNLDESTDSFRFLSKHISRYSRYSLYQVVRYGTTPLPGKKAYMPHYTLERMSNRQLEDLRAFIEWQAGL